MNNWLQGNRTMNDWIIPESESQTLNRFQKAEIVMLHIIIYGFIIHCLCIIIYVLTEMDGGDDIDVAQLWFLCDFIRQFLRRYHQRETVVWQVLYWSFLAKTSVPPIMTTKMNVLTINTTQYVRRITDTWEVIPRVIGMLNRAIRNFRAVERVIRSNSEGIAV